MKDKIFDAVEQGDTMRLKEPVNKGVDIMLEIMKKLIKFLPLLPIINVGTGG